MQNENPDMTQRRLWLTMNSRFGCMGGDKGVKVPWIAACDNEVNRIKESIKIKRAILAGKNKHTKLSNKKKHIGLVDLDSREFHYRLLDKVCKSPTIWAQRKAIQITASQSN